MKKILLSLCVLVTLAGCASNKYCVAEIKNEQDCTQFGGMHGGNCSTHVPQHQIEVKEK